MAWRPRNILLSVKTALIVYNPAARNAPDRDRLAAAAAALDDEWLVELVETAAPGDGVRRAAEASLSGASVVFACGGDGTINEVVNGLAGGNTALGVIRGGMGDVFAKEVRIPRDPEAALRLLLDGERRRFDLGRAGERYFLLMCGVGFDAGIVRRVPNAAKRRLGSASYALWALRQLLGYRARRTALHVNGEDYERDLFWLLLGNTRSYGGVLNITADAKVDDGLLDAYIFAGRGLPWRLLTLLRLALRRQRGARGVEFRRVNELAIDEEGLPVQADGEYLGETPMRFSVAPQALDVLLPPGAGSRLFSLTRS